MYGLSCVEAVNGLGGITLVPFPQSQALQTPLSVIAFANVWDHLDGALEKLRWSVESSEAVLLWGHDVSTSSLQHRIALPRDFARLARLVNADFRDLSGEISGWPESWKIALFKKRR
jgi:hypothetical protein